MSESGRQLVIMPKRSTEYVRANRLGQLTLNAAPSDHIARAWMRENVSPEIVNPGQRVKLPGELLGIDDDQCYNTNKNKLSAIGRL